MLGNRVCFDFDHFAFEQAFVGALTDASLQALIKDWFCCIVPVPTATWSYLGKTQA